MKRRGMLNHQLAGIIAAMGHTDMVVVADAGLPVPPGVATVELAVVAGMPPVADGARRHRRRTPGGSADGRRGSARPRSGDAVQARFSAATLTRLPHETFKQRMAHARAVVRTGACTPYANVILHAGVTF